VHSHRKSVARIRIATIVIVVFAVSTVGRSDEKQLTTDGRVKSSPVFVGQSDSEIVYAVEDSPVQIRLMRLNLADGTQTPLHPLQKNSEFEPSFSADGRWLSYVQSRGNLSLAIVIRDQSQQTEAIIKPAGGFSGPRGPMLTADGSGLLYCFADKDGQQIMFADTRGENRRVVIDTPGISTAPHFAPDGKTFVFSSTRDGNYEIYSAQVDGHEIHRLTDQPRQDLRPRFSSDGQQIAFTSARDGNYEIYVMRADGSDLRRITENPERDDYACWDPSGKHLLYVSERDGRYDLYLREF